MSHIHTPSFYTEPIMERMLPSQYHFEDTHNHETVNSSSPTDLLDKPIVIPQSTNFGLLRFMKNLSPFARCYPCSLSTLSNPITESEFLAFIDRLNQVFVSLPIFQVAHVTGGVLVSVQGVLPAQAIGGFLQVTSLLASAGVSFARVRKFLKTANLDIFAPRGLVCKIMTTKTMMAVIKFPKSDETSKLRLPRPEIVGDIVLPHSRSDSHSDTINTSCSSEVMSGAKDPRLLRLQALEGYISRLNFNVSEAPPENWISRMGQKPLHWAVNRQMKALGKAHEKRDERMKRNEARETYVVDDKTIEKAYKKEEKVANRILWIVISNADGTPVEDESLFSVENGMTP